LNANNLDAVLKTTFPSSAAVKKDSGLKSKR
jgi:hypothetical protein